MQIDSIAPYGKPKIYSSPVFVQVLIIIDILSL